jgi:hypothetical protein
MRKGATSEPMKKNEKNLAEPMESLPKNAGVKKRISIKVYIINIFFLALK